ncbi:MAG: hypothetical protein PVG39_15055 [Desulfobacteraceae bacterium]|jgi:hypothetical protein
MKPKHFLTVIVTLSILGVSFPSFASQKYACDRECMVNFMKQYIKALVKHDPKAVPFADEVKFVENTANIPVGKGLWVTASDGPADFQIYAADPEVQQIACLVMMKEAGADILLGARLKLEEKKISEAEHHVIRDLDSSPFGKMGLANLKTPRPGLLEDVPAAERMPRWKLLEIGLTYYEALTKEDGKLSPFAKECARHENGMVTAGGKPSEFSAEAMADMDEETRKMMEAMAATDPSANTCEGQISTGAFSYISEIRNRRVLIADQQKGLAVGFSMFYHDSTLKEYPYKKPNGETEMRTSYQGTFNLPAVHFYKIRNGKIYEIEAIGFQLPYGTKSGWE